VNGHKVRSTKRGTFIVRIPKHRLRRGRNRLEVVARDAGGATNGRVASFRHC
jgi:hypothetical protein